MEKHISQKKKLTLHKCASVGGVSGAQLVRHPPSTILEESEGTPTENTKPLVAHQLNNSNTSRTAPLFPDYVSHRAMGGSGDTPTKNHHRFAFAEEATTPLTASVKRPRRGEDELVSSGGSKSGGGGGGSRRKSMDFTTAAAADRFSTMHGASMKGVASGTPPTNTTFPGLSASERRQAYTRAHSLRSFAAGPPPPGFHPRNGMASTAVIDIGSKLVNSGGGGSAGSSGGGKKGRMAAWGKARSASYSQSLFKPTLSQQQQPSQQYQHQLSSPQPLMGLRSHAYSFSPTSNLARSFFEFFDPTQPPPAFRRSISTGKTSHVHISSSVATLVSNGSYYDSQDYGDDEDELEEPFSDEDDAASGERRPQKPLLPISRRQRNIRTLSGTVPPVGFSPKWGGPTMCLQCLEFFNLPEMLGPFAEHLLKSHCIVVEEMELIVDPKRYIEYWRQQFAKRSIDTVFPKIFPREDNPYHGRTDYYFELSPRVPEDYSLRQRLAMRRLEEALQCQQREREETTVHLPCIFCRYVARGNRSKVIHHIYMVHHLNLGSPDNMVFVAEYVDHLKKKIERNECIYCEKTFADHPTLMEHMRKKNHREVNPKNHYYDKFYIINYLELGKRWLEVLAEDFEDTMPIFVDSDEEEEEVQSWHEWQEDTGTADAPYAVCLYCDHGDEQVGTLLEHMRIAHTVDLLDYIKRENLNKDTHLRMKLLNYIRKQSFNSPDFYRRLRRRSTVGSIDSTATITSNATTATKIAAMPAKQASIPARSEWDVEENLVPMFDNDHLLWMLESFLEERDQQSAEETTAADEKPQSEEGNEGSVLTPAGTALKASCSLDEEELITSLVVESRAWSVEGVEAEEWPDLSTSVLNDKELIRSLR